MKILYLTYFFPPCGGAGVQRAVKFVKYLPLEGVQPVVITTADFKESRWSPKDDSLATDIRPEQPIYRLHWPEAGHAEIETQRRTWIAEAFQIVQKERPELIFVSVSPFEDLQLASALSAASGLPWIADLRDPWALDEFQLFPHRFARGKAIAKMGEALKSASLVIMNTPEARTEALRALLLEPKRVESLTNGYDEEDIVDEPEPTAASGSSFTVLHSGSFHTGAGLRQRWRWPEYALLGRTVKGTQFLGRSPYYLFKAAQQLRIARPDLGSRLRLVFAGSHEKADLALMKRFALESITTFTGYISHRESVGLFRDANLLFLPMHGLSPGSRATIVPGKTYEYIAAPRRILAAVPEGDARDFLSEREGVYLANPTSTRELYSALEQAMQDWLAGKDLAPPPATYLQRFSRRSLAAQLADALRGVSSSRA